MRRDLFGILGDPDAGAEAARLRAIRVFLLGYGALRGVVWLLIAAGDALPVLPGVAAALVQAVAFALVLRPGTAWVAPRIALPALGLQLALTFPQTANHFYLETFAVALLCLVRRDDPAGEALALRSLRAVTLLVLFHTGLQKLLYGHFLHGDFLAYMIGRGDRFATFFRLLLPEGEIARLAGYDPRIDGAGPYRVSLPLFVAVSNLVWAAELLLPVGLVFRRTRPFAAAAAIALVLSIQLGAREISFALLFSALLALSLPWPARRSGRTPDRSGALAEARAQRRVALAILAFVAVWPLLHRGLVARFGINPWKLAGWAMYTTPVVPTIVVLLREEGGKLTVLDERTLPAEAAEALQRYRDARTAWGTLVAPEPLARAVFEAQPGLEHLVVATQKLTLDPGTARMTSVRENLVFAREDVVGR